MEIYNFSAFVNLKTVFSFFVCMYFRVTHFNLMIYLRYCSEMFIEVPAWFVKYFCKDF